MPPSRKRSRSPSRVTLVEADKSKSPKSQLTSLPVRSPQKSAPATTKQPSIASFFLKATAPSSTATPTRSDNLTSNASTNKTLARPPQRDEPPVVDSDSEDEVRVPKKRKLVRKAVRPLSEDEDEEEQIEGAGSHASPLNLSDEKDNVLPRDVNVLEPKIVELPSEPQGKAPAPTVRKVGQQGLWGRQVIANPKRSGKGSGGAVSGDTFEFNQGYKDSLPPISDIYDVFDDMVQKLDKSPRLARMGLKDAFAHIGSRKLRIGTMCSGTESPILALRLISKSLQKLLGIELNVDHLFSAEIVPFKQAFIERNFAPPVIFRDIKELLSNTDEATSAYGALLPVPTDLDMLVAGFSCVDFSNLNNFKRKMEEVGESGDTLRAILAYCEKHRPRIVVLENVFGAPWDKIQTVWEKTLGYHCAWDRFDTKDYYIPHTRQRGYMVCIDKQAVPLGQRMMKDWQMMVSALQRPASSPIDTFTVDEDHPLMQRAREEMSRNLYADEIKTKTVEWIKCLARHHDTRERLHLGIKRPYCGWVDGGSAQLPDWNWVDWGKAQVERIWDTCEISYLRNARRGFDMRYKTRVLQLSQNVDRDTDTQKFGITGCVTPTGIPFLTYRGRPVTGLESLVQQGLPVDEILITRESQSQLQDLAGNAMSTTVVGAVMFAAICIGYKALPKGERQGLSHADSGAEVAHHIKDHAHLVTRSLDLGGYKPMNKTFIIKQAQRSSRLCLCEGRDSLTAHDLQQCHECGHSTCVQCGGNPTHAYKPIPKEFTANRMSPSSFKKDLMNALPLRFRLHGSSFVSPGVLKTLGLKIAASDWQIFSDGVENALNSELRYDSVKRGPTWVVLFRSSSAQLELHLNPDQVEWRAYAIPAKSLPGNSRHRAILGRPFARMRPSENDLTTGTWEVYYPANHTFKVHVKGQGQKVKSWEARIGLLEPQFADKRVWSELLVSTEDGASNYLDSDISGVYKYLPDCAAAQDSLHKRVGKPSDIPLFLFLDPHLYKPAADDPFVFSFDISRPDYDKNTNNVKAREVVARMGSRWRPSASKDATQTIDCTVDGKWVSDNQLKIVPVTSVATATQSSPSTRFNFNFDKGSCAAALTIVSCKFELTSQDRFGHNVGQWFEITRTNARTVFSQVNWITERVRNVEGLDDWHDVCPDSSASLHERCERCAPKSARVRWRLQGLQRLVPYEDPQDAGPYERSLKNRPEPFITQIRTDNDNDCMGYLRVGLNAVSLIHQALANLPGGGTHTQVSWRLHTDYHPPAYPTYPTFTLSNNKQTSPAKQPPNFKTDYRLRPEQLRSLGGMLENESDDARPFVEEEVVEALLPQMGWRAEGRATTEVQIKGGVLADQVGYGKTATTLALIDTQFNANKQRPDSNLKGKISVKGTLLICPPTLVDQWEAEIMKFLGSKYRVLKLRTIESIKANTIASIIEADIIICSWSLFTSETYLLRVAEFAGLPEMPATTGRAFDAWYGKALENIYAHVDKLHERGASELQQLLNNKYEALLVDEDVTSFVPSKRLKGLAYRKVEQQKKEALAVSCDKEENSKAKQAKPPVVKARLVDPFGLTSKAVQKDWKMMKSPLLQLFHFNRLVVDEFTYVKAESHTCITSLASTYRWVLSGTPPLNDFADVKSIAVFLGVHLGIDDDSLGAIKGRNIKLIRKERTAGEAFRSFAQTLSPAWHDHRQTVAQRFLDQFVRQNIAEIDAFTVHDKVQAINLPAAERAIYNELLHILTAQDMRIRRGKAKAESDRERRVNELLGESRSAEEALLKRCSHFTLADLNDQTGNNAQQACEIILRLRQAQFSDLVADLRMKFKHAVLLKRQVGEADTHWTKLEASLQNGSIWGDAEATTNMSQLIKEAYTNYQKQDEDLFYRDTDVEKEAKDRKEAKQRADAAKTAAKAAKKVKEAERRRRAQEKRKRKAKVTTKSKATKSKVVVESDDEAEDSAADASSISSSDSGSDDDPTLTDEPAEDVYVEYTQAPRLHSIDEKKLALRNLVLTAIRGLIGEYVGRLRSLRYFQSIRCLQLAQTNNIGTAMSSCHKCKNNVAVAQLFLVGPCGHIGCTTCVGEAIEAGHGDTCPIVGCQCPALLAAAHKATELGSEDPSTRTGKHYGKKLESIVQLINNIPKDDQVLLFVQFEDLLEKCKEIFADKGVRYYAISSKSGKNASEEMTNFQLHTGASKKKVLILNLADETAAGANLTNANHIIFLSPLLTESQYKYSASMTQAIGRVVRYGQKKQVHIWRFLSLDTIDVSIVQEREKKALVRVKGDEWKLIAREECETLEEKGLLDEVHGAQRGGTVGRVDQMRQRSDGDIPEMAGDADEDEEMEG
ncbi:hypothetical protein K504DRAFT_532750 [Pleomassaria siparia CBS 279.74]|uniref:Helicase C-terminal domain-containing protein n=1 Tax=Pleomassaria siparia CBS 279.74 TaxID=1314801 RepID=A0A6G1KFA3_9PLEO|nr:hypothetical protein K504DRAFT_532750 [Pleomassaria siparia CBS 279.74]